jgi:DNA phosphorothioation-associated putative methyltransferase
MEGATLIKFHTSKPKISYLFYPEFDTEPYPSLHTSMQIDLRDLIVTYRDYDSSDNPPILHRKETFVGPNYPLFEKFTKLTQQEEEWGTAPAPLAHARAGANALKSIVLNFKAIELSGVRMQTLTK